MLFCSVPLKRSYFAIFFAVNTGAQWPLAMAYLSHQDREGLCAATKVSRSTYVEFIWFVYVTHIDVSLPGRDEIGRAHV